MKPLILVVDDELSIRESFNLILSDDYRVIAAASGEAALKYAADEPVNLVYLDIRMPGLDGLETLKRLRQISPELLVVMVTAVNDVQKAAEAINLGSVDYVVKPFDVERIRQLTQDLLRRQNLIKTAREVAREEYPELMGLSEVMVKVKKAVDSAAARETSVLIVGEEGVEDEWIAYNLKQADKPFVSLNLKSLNPLEMESYIFSASSGSSTVDLKKKVGAVEEAGGGILFLRGIEKLSPDLQDKLIEIRPRLIASTTMNLKEGDFSRKLYDKLSENLIMVPPLRERISDVPSLISYFLSQFNLKYRRNLKGLSTRAQELLTSYPFPHNVAELRQIVQLLVLTVNKPIIEAEDLPLRVLTADSSFYPLPLNDSYDDFEIEYIKRVLAQAGGEYNRAAERLGVTPVVLELKTHAAGRTRTDKGV